MTRLRTREWHVIDGISQAAAVEFITSTHYAQGAPNTSVARHALVRADEPEEIKGVALWLPPTKPAAVSVGGEDWRQVLALSRLCIAPDVPKNGASYLLGCSMRTLDRTRWPVLLTYADTALGHTGAIYRATNWTCLGEVRGTDNWIGPGGERRGRKRGGRNFSAAEMRAMGYIRLPSAPKLKFVHDRRRRAARPDAVAQPIAA